MKNNNLTEAKKWFYVGDNEFGFACLGLNSKQDEFYAQVCFLFQQAIEKYLKGYLVAHNLEIEKTHNLRYLCQQCITFNKEFGKFIEDCEIIDQYYIPTRYPVHWSIHTKVQAKEAHIIAKKVINFIKEEFAILKN